MGIRSSPRRSDFIVVGAPLILASRFHFQSSGAPPRPRLIDAPGTADSPPSVCYYCAYIVHGVSSMNPETVLHPNAGTSFDQFMTSLRDPDSAAPIVSARRFGDALHIDLQTLAQQAHVHRNTLSRQPASESVQRFLREALRVIRAATDISGDVNQALFWYRNEPLPVF